MIHPVLHQKQVLKSWNASDTIFWPLATAASPSGKTIVWLKDLTIKGDLSRVENWDPEAFKNCPCEEEYLRLRGGVYGGST